MTWLEKYIQIQYDAILGKRNSLTGAADTAGWKRFESLLLQKDAWVREQTHINKQYKSPWVGKLRVSWER